MRAVHDREPTVAFMRSPFLGCDPRGADVFPVMVPGHKAEAILAAYRTQRGDVGGPYDMYPIIMVGHGIGGRRDVTADWALISLACRGGGGRRV